MTDIKLYLAGPDVFRPDAKEHGKKLQRICTDLGALGLYPLDNEIKFTGDKYQDALGIFRANVALIRDCHAVVANLEPFRGPSADVGTVWEIGYAKGLGKPVVGYGTWPDKYHQRVINMKIPHDGMMIEDFDMFDNLMVVGGCTSVDLTFYMAVKTAIQLIDPE